ncbi:MAG TPA: helical backbone metal receptor, partial [Phnomibacter sp.]|nr:helical backbone metal receptor [Phnomibacter sp.]
MEVEPPLEAGTIYGTYRPALHQHIVSVVPSQTELLHYLGLDSQIAGITRFCTQPPHWHKTKTRIGGTKDINLHKVQQLKPTLLLANEEENTREQVLAIAEYCPVYVSKVHNLDTALGMMVDVGRLTQTDLRACQLAHDIRAAFNSLPLVAPPLRVAYLIWKEPYMAAGGHTFINDRLQWAGF